MAYLVDCPRLVEETRNDLLLLHHIPAQHLDRHLAAQPRMGSPVDHAHPPLAQHGGDAVAAEHITLERRSPSHRDQLVGLCVGRIDSTLVFHPQDLIGNLSLTINPTKILDMSAASSKRDVDQSLQKDTFF